MLDKGLDTKFYEDGTCKVVKSKPPLVIFHSPCLDGFTAAWAMWLKHPEAEFVPAAYGQNPPDCAGRDVYLLDFSYKRPTMEKIVQTAEHVTVLDHHKTAEAELASMDTVVSCQCDVVFDMNKSGARLAWEWFHPGVEVPMLVAYVEHRDLGHVWQPGGRAYPEAKAINAALFSYGYDFKLWSALRNQLDTPVGFSQLLSAGLAIERKQQKDIRELVGKTMTRRSIGGVMVPCANLPYTLASDAANLMAEGEPFAATYYNDKEGCAVFSLRSREGGADVSEVAKLYGGGGHKHAAGFRVELVNHMLGLYDYGRETADAIGG